MNIVSMIVDQQHVGLSVEDVCREVIGRLRNGMDAYLALPRETRRLLLVTARDRHLANRQCYMEVMYPSYR